MLKYDLQSEEDQALVQNEVNNFLNSAGKSVVDAIKETKNADVRRPHPNVEGIKMGPVYATVPYYRGQYEWPIKHAPQCALITWIKWVLQTIKFIYDQGMQILRINNALNL